MTKKDRVKRLYLDVCTLCRPFDEQSGVRIRIETDAFFLILNAVQAGRFSLIASPVHRAEIGDISNSKERMELLSLLERIGEWPRWDLAGVRRRAEALALKTFGVADATHVAFAEAGADVFVSCDDRLLKKCRRQRVSVPALNPVEFCMSEDLR